MTVFVQIRGYPRSSAAKILPAVLYLTLASRHRVAANLGGQIAGWSLARLIWLSRFNLAGDFIKVG